MFSRKVRDSKSSHSIPRFESETAVVSELHEEDAEGIYNYASHSRVARTVLWEAHKDVEESRAYIRLLNSQISFGPGNVFVAWGVTEKGVPGVIGSVTLKELGPIRAQIGFVFHYDHWKSRNPLEALRMVFDWAFETFPQYERVQARCFPHNVASTDLLSRLGLQSEGINKAMVKIRGEVMDLACFAMTRPRWEAIRNEPKSQRVSQDDLGSHI